MISPLTYSHEEVQSVRYLLLLHSNFAEAQSTGFTNRSQTAGNGNVKELLVCTTLDLELLEIWCDIPDVFEGQASKIKAPAPSHWTGAEDTEKLVAAVLAAIEAVVTALPTAIDRVGSLRLTEDVFEHHLLTQNLFMVSMISGVRKLME